MCENTSCATEIRNLQTALEDAQALLAGAQRDLANAKQLAEQAFKVRDASWERLNKARNVFEDIWARDDIDLESDVQYADLAELLGFEATVKVWVTVQAQWSQEVSLPRGFNDGLIEIETDIADRLTISYDGNELDTELTQDEVRVEASE